MSDEFVRVAKVQITQRKYPDAVKTVRRGLLGDPDHIEGRLVLGMALMAMRRYGEVRAEMAMALETAPTHPVALRLEAEAYLKEGDLAKAESSLKRALHAAPADVVTRELLSELEEAKKGGAEETTTVERWFDPGRAQVTQVDFQDDETTVRGGQTVDDFEQGVETRVVDAETAEKLRQAAGISDAEKTVLTQSPFEETTSAKVTVRMQRDSAPPEEEPLPRDTLPPSEPILAHDEATSVEDDDVLSEEEMDDLVVDETSSVSDAPAAPLSFPAPTVRTTAASASPRPSPPTAPARPPSALPAARPPMAARPSAPPPPARPRTSSGAMPAVSASAPSAAAASAAPRPSAPPPAGRPRSQTLLGMPALGSQPPPRPVAMPQPPKPAPLAPAPPAAKPAAAAAAQPAPRPADPLPDLDDLGYDDDEPATMIRESGRDLAGIAAAAMEEPVADVAPLGKTMPPSRMQAAPLRPSAPPPARPSAPPPPRSPSVVVAPSVGHDRRFDPTPPPRRTGAMEVPSMPPTPPDADPLGRVAIPSSRPAPLEGPLAPRGRRSTAVFIVAGVAGGAVLLAAAILVIRTWSRGEKREEHLAEAARADLSGSEADLRASLAANEAILESDSDSPEARAAVARAAAWLAVEYEDPQAAARAEAVLAGIEGPPLGAATEARALLLFRGGRVADAERTLAAVAPPDARTLYARALCAAARGEYDVAARSLGQAAMVSPGDVRVSALLAETLYRLGDANGANQRLAAADPTGIRSRTRLARARALVFAGRDAEARGEAEALLAMTPPAPAAERAWAELIRARALRTEDPAAANSAADRSEQGRRPWDVEFAMTRARLLLDLGRPREARVEAERAQGAAPNRPEVQLLVAEGALESGDLEAAASALASVPPLSEAAALAGEVALARGDLAAAKTRFEEASRDAALAPRARIGLARVAVYEGRIRDASRLLDEVPAGTTGAAVLGAEVKWSLGQTDAAREALASAGADPAAKVFSARMDAWTGRIGPATQTLRTLVGATPANVAARVALADLLQQAGELPAAAEQIEAARTLAPASADVQLALVYQAAAEGRLEQAEPALGAARSAGAPSPAVARATGRLALAKGQATHAIESLRAALRGAPRDPWIHVWMGQAYLLDERAPDASDEFVRALRVDPHLPEAHVGLALAGLVAGSFSAVGDNLDRTERDLSDHPRGDKLHAQILFVKGRFHWENGNYDEAASRLRDATGKDPTLAEAFAYLGYAITDGRGNHDEACAAFARYTTLAPGGPESGEVRRQSRGCR